jgi:hypothetical protein
VGHQEAPPVAVGRGRGNLEPHRHKQTVMGQFLPRTGLSGHDEETMRTMIFDGGVETRVVDGQHLIDAKSLEEYQMSLVGLKCTGSVHPK